MVLNMNKAILLVFLISVSQMAVAQDRTAVLPTLEKLCENDLLGSPHDLAAFVRFTYKSSGLLRLHVIPNDRPFFLGTSGRIFEVEPIASQLQ